jgi:hypothetical protein
VVEHLPSKFKAELSLIPSTTKKKRSQLPTLIPQSRSPEAVSPASQELLTHPAGQSCTWVFVPRRWGAQCRIRGALTPRGIT